MWSSRSSGDGVVVRCGQNQRPLQAEIGQVLSRGQCVARLLPRGCIRPRTQRHMRSHAAGLVEVEDVDVAVPPSGVVVLDAVVDHDSLRSDVDGLAVASRRVVRLVALRRARGPKARDRRRGAAGDHVERDTVRQPEELVPGEQRLPLDRLVDGPVVGVVVVGELPAVGQPLGPEGGTRERPARPRFACRCRTPARLARRARPAAGLARRPGWGRRPGRGRRWATCRRRRGSRRVRRAPPQPRTRRRSTRRAAASLPSAG